MLGWTRVGLTVLLAGLITLVTSVPARAANGDLTHVFPNGARRGQRLKLSFGGTEIPASARLLGGGSALRALGTFEKGQGEVEIAADAAPGILQLRLAGATGGTSPRPFAVGGITEELEKEPNNSPGDAQTVEALPVTVNGRLPTRGDVDLWKVNLRKGECLVVAGESRALGAPTNLLVRIRNLAGVELVTQMDSRTRDPQLGFVAPSDGAYLVELSDVMNNYSGINDDYVYRVTFTTGAWIDRAFPPMVQTGRPSTVKLIGWNLGGQRGPGQEDRAIAVPEGAPRFWSAFREPNANRLILATTPHPVVVEQESTPGTPETAAPITVPGAATGELGRRGDRDRFSFAARKGVNYSFRAFAQRLTSVADLVLWVTDSSGKMLASADDSGGRGRDPVLEWRAPSDGTFHLEVLDLPRRGGPDFFYAVEVSEPEPELEAKLASPTLEIKRGATLEVTVTANRRRVDGDLVVRVDGLPAGVSAQVVPGSAATSPRFKLTAAADAAPGSFLLQFLVRPPGQSQELPAEATWELSKDRSGTLATGSTQQVLLTVLP